MKHVTQSRDAYILTYTDPKEGYKRIQVDTISSTFALAEAILQIRKTGYSGPIELSKHWILKSNDNKEEEYWLETPISFDTIHK